MTRSWTPRFSGYGLASMYMTDFFYLGLRTDDHTCWPTQPGSSPSDGFVSLRFQTGSPITVSVSTFQLSCFHRGHSGSGSDNGLQ